jgi:2-dehydro-3-deoxyglucarate aldolase
MLKNKLKNNELTVGSWISIAHPDVVEVMATAGFEWLVVDMEHTATDINTAKNLIATIKANGMQPLVRVGANDELIIKRVLDSGAEGIIVPMIKNAIEAKRAVDFVKYPPHGKRGVGLYRAQNYGTTFSEYQRWNQENSVVIAQIEHIDAVKNIEEILLTEGIDGIMVGPYDLSASMGYPGEYDREDVKEALEIVKKACRNFNKPLGFHVIKSEAQFLQEKIEEGYTFLAFSIDFFFLGDRVREEMGKIRSVNNYSGS